MIVTFGILLIALLYSSSSIAADDPGSATVIYEFGEVPARSCMILESQERHLEVRESDPGAAQEIGTILRDQARSVQEATAAAGGNAVLMVRQSEAIGVDGAQTYITQAYALRCAVPAR